VLIAYRDHDPVLIGADPTIKALIAVGDSLVSRAMISVSMVFVWYRKSKEQIASRTPYTWEGGLLSIAVRVSVTH